MKGICLLVELAGQDQILRLLIRRIWELWWLKVPVPGTMARITGSLSSTRHVLSLNSMFYHALTIVSLPRLKTLLTNLLKIQI